MARPQPATRMRTCLGCGAVYEYPVKDSRATRFHCEGCADLPKPIRETFERLTARIRKLEKEIGKSPSPPKSSDSAVKAPSAMPETPPAGG